MDASLRSKLAGLACLFLLLVGLLTGDEASAEIRVPPPQGWNEGPQADPDARARASGWASAAKMQLIHLSASAGEDDYAESLVVLGRSAPLTKDEAAQPRAALMRLRGELTPILGLTDETAENSNFIETPDGAAFRAQWTLDGIRYDTLLVPSGDSFAIVILSFRAEEAVLYRDLADEVFLGTLGAAAPIRAFSGTPWRWGSFGLWILMGLGLHLLMTRFTDHAGDHRNAAHRAAAILAAAATLGAIITYLVLRGESTAIEAADSSVSGVVSEVLVGGLVVAAILIGVAYAIDRGGRIQSAPESMTHDTFKRARPEGHATEDASLEEISHGQARSAVPGHVNQKMDNHGREPGDDNAPRQPASSSSSSMRPNGGPPPPPSP